MSDGAGVLLIDVKGSYFEIDEGGLDVGVAHQPHERGEADAGAHHVGGEGVAETVRVGLLNPGGAPMIAEQRAQTGRRHAGSAGAALEGDE